MAEDTYGGLSEDVIQQALADLRNGLGRPENRRPETWQDRLAASFSSPLMNFGLGMLMAPGNYGSFSTALGHGLANVQQGLAARNEAQQAARAAQVGSAHQTLRLGAELDRYRAGIEERREKKREKARMERILESLTPEERRQWELAQLGIAPKEQEPTSAMRNYQFLRAQGVRDEDAQELAFGSEKVRIDMGSTPQGSKPITNEAGEVVGYQPQPGAPQYQELQDEAQRISQGLASVGEMRDLIARYGSEGTPLSDQAVRGKMQDLYGRIVSAIAASRGMGVLQEGERQAVEAQYPNPATFGSNFVPDERMLGAYESLASELETSLKARQHQMQGGAGIVTPFQGTQGTGKKLSDDERAELDALRMQMEGRF